MPATAATLAHQPETRSRLSDLIFILQASRPGLWSTQVWFYLLPLGQRNVFHSAAFWLRALYCTFPLGLLLYGSKDYVALEIDSIHPRTRTFPFCARAA